MLFERFISKERGEPPDIDVDFEHERRPEVIAYIYKKYGRERAALAAAVITYRTKGALRDAGRVLGFETARIDALTASLAWWDKREQLPERFAEQGLDPASPRVEKWLWIAEQLRGFPRHLTQHVGGFVMSRGPLARLVPVENTAMAERTVIQWDKDDLDAVGLMKVDVLALGMLSAIRRMLSILSEMSGRPWKMADIPAEDPATYEMLCHADSMGVFQVESRAQMAMLPRLKPRNFYDLVTKSPSFAPARFRATWCIPTSAATGQGAHRESIAAVDAVLARTYGVPIFQEQVMQLAVVAANFTSARPISCGERWRPGSARAVLNPSNKSCSLAWPPTACRKASPGASLRRFRASANTAFPNPTLPALRYSSTSPPGSSATIRPSSCVGCLIASRWVLFALHAHSGRQTPRCQRTATDVTSSDWDSRLDENGAVRLRQISGLSKRRRNGLLRSTAPRRKSPWGGISPILECFWPPAPDCNAAISISSPRPMPCKAWPVTADKPPGQQRRRSCRAICSMPRPFVKHPPSFPSRTMVKTWLPITAAWA
jgi:error-prone DNA polymerase